MPVSNAEIIQDNVLNKNDKLKRTSVENLIEMLENEDKDNDDEDTINDLEDKLIAPSDIKQEAIIHTDLENIDDEEELDDNVLLDDDDSDYEGNDDSKNDGESNSPRKLKVNRNSLKKKTPDILIPQMVRKHLFLSDF